MQVRLITRHFNRSQLLVAHVQARVAQALSRFQQNVRDVEIRISDINGPRGGTDIACLAHVRFVRGGNVIVESVASSAESGIAQLVNRLAQKVRRTFNRRKNY